jgi:hypothetical protein
LGGWLNDEGRTGELICLVNSTRLVHLTLFSLLSSSLFPSSVNQRSMLSTHAHSPDSHLLLDMHTFPSSPSPRPSPTPLDISSTVHFQPPSHGNSPLIAPSQHSQQSSSTTLLKQEQVLHFHVHRPSLSATTVNAHHIF